MAVVETEIHDKILIIRMNRPERLNALNSELRAELALSFTEFHESTELDVAILTGAGRGFCAGEDMKESVERGRPGGGGGWNAENNPFLHGGLEKPVISAINGFAMGGGFRLVERTDLRVAVRGAIFEISEAKRWLLGGYDHGHFAGLPHAIATEMALGFRFTAERLFEVGFLNRLADAEDLMPTAMEMAEHLLSLPPATLVNTTYMMSQVRPEVADDLKGLAGALREHGDEQDLMESRKAFTEKRKPVFKGWKNPEDRYKTPRRESFK